MSTASSPMHPELAAFAEPPSSPYDVDTGKPLRFSPQTDTFSTSSTATDQSDTRRAMLICCQGGTDPDLQTPVTSFLSDSNGFVSTRSKNITQVVLNTGLVIRFNNLDTSRSFFDSRFRHSHVVGRGAQSVVRRCVIVGSNAYAVVKEYSPECHDECKREYQCVMKCAHLPNVVQCYGYGEVQTKAGVNSYLVFQRLTEDLEHTLDVWWSLNAMSSNRAAYTLRQILLGLAQIHASNVLHLDLKPKNIFVDNHGNAVIGDFGVAAVVNDTRLQTEGYFSCTLPFAAPEGLCSSGYRNKISAATDIWSVGCILFCMLQGELPWQYDGDLYLKENGHENIDQRAWLIKTIKVPNNRPTLRHPEYVSDLGKAFLDLCFEHDWTKRPSALELLTHPFVCNYTPDGPQPPLCAPPESYSDPEGDSAQSTQKLYAICPPREIQKAPPQLKVAWVEHPPRPLLAIMPHTRLENDSPQCDIAVEDIQELDSPLPDIASEGAVPIPSNAGECPEGVEINGSPFTEENDGGEATARTKSCLRVTSVLE